MFRTCPRIAAVLDGRDTRVCSTVQRRRDPAGYGDDGFTLVETIVSFTIFAIVSVAAALALVTGIKSNNDTTDRVLASQLAQRATDQTRAMSRLQLAAQATTSTDQTVGNKVFKVTRTVTSSAQCLTTPPAVSDQIVRKIMVHVEVAIPGDSNGVVQMDSVVAC